MLSKIFGKREEWETKELTVFNIDSAFAFLLYEFIDQGYIQVNINEIQPKNSPTGRPTLQLSPLSQHDKDLFAALREVVDVLPNLAPQNVLQDQSGTAVLKLREKLQHINTVCPGARNIVVSAMEHNQSLFYVGWDPNWIVRSHEEIGWNYLRSFPAYDKDLLVGTIHVFQRPKKKTTR